MTYLNTLPEQISRLLLMLMFAEAMCEFALILRYKISQTGRRWHVLPSCFMLILIFALLALCMPESHNIRAVPVVLVAMVLLIAAVHIAVETVHNKRHRSNELSPYAIKETVDDLPTGVCFADTSGRIILCNRRMGELSALLLGSYPQTAGELEVALRAPQESSGILRISENPVLHRFPDGKVWRFRSAELPETGGFLQITAQDVTALYDANERLRAENEEIRKVNEKLRLMYERLAERIREQETLDLKMRIHNNIGSSLIAISEIMNNDNDGDMRKQIDILKDAVGYFSDDRPAVHGTFDELRRKSAEMKVSLVLRGSLPQNTVAESLIIAAAKECVTNCVNHAKGNRVTVEIAEHFNIYTVTITNNGEPPKHRIVEGGGLSNLRRSVEAAGGEMYISHSPAFALILNLPRKEQEI